MKQLVIIICLMGSIGWLPAQSLEALIQEALDNNPAISQFESRYEIAKEKVQEVNTIPNTEFGAGYFVSEPETRTGPQRFKLSVKQMLPWFGSITARENYSESLSEAAFEEVALMKRKLSLKVAQSYYALYALQAKQSIFLENIELLDTYETMALTSVEVGKASAVDVLRLQMRQNELQQSLAVLEEEVKSEQSQLKQLLNREDSVSIIVTKDLSIPTVPEEIKTDSLQLHPELVKLDKLYESITQSELLNQKEQGPMIGFGIDYINVDKRPDMDFSDNGKDILMPMVSVSIPIFNKKFNSISKQNELRQKELQFQRQDRYNSLVALLEKAENNRKAARIQFETQEKNLVQAKNAENIVIRNYETGTIDFNDVLDIQELQLKFQLQKIDATKKYYMQSTLINYLTNQ